MVVTCGEVFRVVDGLVFVDDGCTLQGKSLDETKQQQLKQFVNEIKQSESVSKQQFFDCLLAINNREQIVDALLQAFGSR